MVRYHNVYIELRHNAPVLLIVSLIALAAMSGCQVSSTESERPVDNPIPAAKPGVYTVKTVDVPPTPTSDKEPAFPQQLNYVVSGMAFVAFTVRTDGSVEDASTVRADDVLFGEAAVAAVLKWRFRPAQLKGVPVDCQMTMPFYFSNTYGVSGEESEPASPPGNPSESRSMTLEPQK
jgi:protein TonB